MAEPKASVREKTIEILMRLTEDERKVLSAVLRIEREVLHQKLPQNISKELLREVSKIIKDGAP